MKRTFLVAIGLMSLALLSFTFSGDELPYKNLKILPKDITEKQMDSVMHHYTESLGVKCNFCHVRRQGEEHPDFASDENKHKLKAREMMHMTNKINEKYFDETGSKITLNTHLMVTCYTCHHGGKDPATRAMRTDRGEGPRIERGNNQDSTRRAR